MSFIAPKIDIELAVPVPGQADRYIASIYLEATVTEPSWVVYRHSVNPVAALAQAVAAWSDHEAKKAVATLNAAAELRQAAFDIVDTLS